VNFLPAISRDSMKEIKRRIRSWHIQLDVTEFEKAAFDGFE
jgi:hypothetical protein